MDVEITELEKIEADRIDGVGMPANGIPVLLLKQVAPQVAKGARDCPKCDKSYDADHQGSKCENCGADLPDADASKAAGGAEKPEFDREAAKAAVKAIVGRKVDETPDIAGGTAVLAQIADLIIAEAQELKSGQAGEIADIQQLACAAEMIWCWRTGEEAAGSGSVMPATALMQSAWEYPADELAKDSREFSAAERKKHAAEGNALPDGSYPIPDADALRRAAILARSGHGDVTAAKKLIARRAKELGVANPLDDAGDTSKSQIAPEGEAVDTVTQGTGDLTQIVEAAVTKAVQPHMERVTALEAELAKVKALPVPGGPMMAAVPQAKAADGEDHAAKAAYYDRMAGSLASPQDADTYRQLAAQERAKITAS